MNTILKVLFLLLFICLPTSALGQAVSDRVISHTIRSEHLGGAETATARKLLFVHGVRFAALLGIGGGSSADALLLAG